MSARRRRPAATASHRAYFRAMKVAVLPPVSLDAPADRADRLPGREIRLVPDRDGVRAAVADADALVAMFLGAGDARAATSLRLCQVFSAGYDAVAIDALPPGCAACNASAHEIALGEHVLGATLMLTRRLGERDRALRAGRFDQGAGFDRDLAGRVVGVIGLGAIGLRVAGLFRALGMRAIAVTARPSPGRAAAAGLDWLGGPGCDDLRELLRRADVAVVAVPRTAATEGLIGAQELAALGPEGILVNSPAARSCRSSRCTRRSATAASQGRRSTSGGATRRRVRRSGVPRRRRSGSWRTSC